MCQEISTHLCWRIITLFHSTGLQGEAGAQTVKMKSSHDTVNLMLEHMTNTDNKIHLPLTSGNKSVRLKDKIFKYLWCRVSLSKLNEESMIFILTYMYAESTYILAAVMLQD